ncbi:MAG: paraquat-inducible membrane protein A [Rhodobacteraceae bacterium]|nr:paraquat-inducible membrane protein A [Paracoccaceae bacterium]
MRRLPLLLSLVLLVALPLSWAAPLLRAGLLPLFGLSEISVLTGLQSLWHTDRALALLVALFAIVVPWLKTLALALQFAGWLPARLRPVLPVLGKLSMAEVFLLALYIVIVKGVGLAHVETAWGLWFFTGCILASLALSLIPAASSR